LHFNERHAYHDIYTYGSALVKDPGFYFGFMAHCGPQGLVSTEDAKNRRSLLGPMFSRRAVLELDFTVQLKVWHLAQKWFTSSDSGIQMAMAYRSITTDVITEYCFAESANTLTPGFDHPMKTQYEIDGLLKNPDSLSGTNHETIYHHLLNPKDQAPLSQKTLVDEAFTLVSAGSEAVGGVCTVGTFYALKNRTIYTYRKLLEELCKAWPDKDILMSYVALEKFPYLVRDKQLGHFFLTFIKEALRFSIGVCHPLPRIVRASTEIGGYRIPSGVRIQMLYLAWCELYLIFGNIFRNFKMTLLDTGS
ncbi:cytochrome P450, partial [Lentinula detonsa]